MPSPIATTILILPTPIATTVLILPTPIAPQKGIAKTSILILNNKCLMGNLHPRKYSCDANFNFQDTEKSAMYAKHGWGNLTEICYRKDSAVTRENRKFFQKRVKKAFISWLAYKGYLPDVCKNGQLPQWMDVHHIHPLGGGGTNEFSNLVIIPKTKHVRMNKEFFSCVSDLKEGESRHIVVPSFVDDRGNPMFVDYDGIREYVAASGRGLGPSRGRGSNFGKGKDGR